MHISEDYLSHCHFTRKQFTNFNSYLIFQEANKRNNNWLPPPWAIAAMLILGFNEFMTLLRYIFFLYFEI
jgi:hypothetical protein